MLDHVLEKVASPIYTLLLILFYATYISTAFGLWYVYPNSLHILTTFMQIFIGTVLILRFHPFFSTRRQLQDWDHRFIFASAVMLLINAGLVGFLQKAVHI